MTTGRATTLPVVFSTRNFSNPCHRCHLAKLFSYQVVAGDNEVATVTRNGVLALKMSEK